MQSNKIYFSSEELQEIQNNLEDVLQIFRSNSNIRRAGSQQGRESYDRDSARYRTPDRDYRGREYDRGRRFFSRNDDYGDGGSGNRTHYGHEDDGRTHPDPAYHPRDPQTGQFVSRAEAAEEDYQKAYEVARQHGYGKDVNRYAQERSSSRSSEEGDDYQKSENDNKSRNDNQQNEGSGRRSRQNQEESSSQRSGSSRIRSDNRYKEDAQTNR